MSWRCDIRIKAELAQTFAPLDVGQTFMGHPIISTVPGSPQVVLDVDGDGATVRRRMSDLVAQGLVRDWRREKDDFLPLWIPPEPGALDAQPLYEIGDTFPSAALRALGAFGADVRLGIVDTGLWPGHQAFQGCTVLGADGSGDLQDTHGHGTHVATTAASQWGIAKAAMIIMGRGLDGAGGAGSESGIANKIRRLADLGCQVISLSLGGSTSQVMDAACEYAKSKGAVVIAAAGNTPNAAIGSPARAADLIVLACDRQRQYATFSSGRAWPNGNRVTDYGVDIRAASKDVADGSFEASGTSMAAPHQAGKAACLAGAGLTREQIIGYLLGHRVSPPNVGVAELAADYGSAPGEGGGNVDEVRTRLEAIRAECDRDGLRWWDIKPGDSKLDVEAFARDIQSGLGRIYEHAGVALVSLPPKIDEPAPGPSPPPVTPQPLLLRLGYPHWDGSQFMADGYADSGLGTPIRVQLGGRGEGWSSITPLHRPGEITAAWEAGWSVQRWDEDAPRLCMEATAGVLGETMFEYLLRATDGNSYGFGHVQQQPAKFGPVDPWDTLCLLGKSGIVGICGPACQGCDPEHVHLRGWRGHGAPPPGGAGNIPIAEVCERLGIVVLETMRCVSPTDYQQCRARAGRFI